MLDAAMRRCFEMDGKVKAAALPGGFLQLFTKSLKVSLLYSFRSTTVVKLSTSLKCWTVPEEFASGLDTNPGTVAPS